jgi:hypothetical protein
MSDTSAPLSVWQLDLETAICEHCQWRMLVPSQCPPEVCPNCCHGPLALIPGGLPEMPYPYPPELAAPFEVTKQGLEEAVRGFASGIPFAPKDLNPAKLQARLRPVYLPMWLVDSSVTALWKAEAAYKYEVISHQEFYDGDRGRWTTREVKEPRLRWEPRLGRLKREYQNVLIPAVDDYERMQKLLGGFSLKQVLPYNPERVQQACIRLPDNTPQEIWNEAATAFQKTASGECQQACEADQIRQFRWKASFTRPNWTLLLLPVYASHYQDDQGQIHPVIFHGQTGKAVGKGRSSSKQASRTSLELFAAGAVLLALGLLLESINASNQMLNIISMSVLLIGMAGIIASAVPHIIVWDFNRRQMLEEHREKLKGAL